MTKIQPDQFSSDGWTPVLDTWTYASAVTITVPAGALLIYSNGDRIRLTQTTVKYFNVRSVADTVLTLVPSSDYTLVNAAISEISYSKLPMPVGFPSSFNFDGSWSGFSSISTDSCAFVVIGSVITLSLNISGTSNATTLSFTPPIPMSEYQLAGPSQDNGGWNTDPAFFSPGGAPVTIYKNPSLSAWTASGTKLIFTSLTYRF